MTLSSAGLREQKSEPRNLLRLRLLLLQKEKAYSLVWEGGIKLGIILKNRKDNSFA
jgi:hypothetical protein